MTVAVQLSHHTVITLLMDNDRSYHRVRLPALHVAAKADDVRAATLLLQRDSSRPKVTHRRRYSSARTQQFTKPSKHRLCH